MDDVCTELTLGGLFVGRPAPLVDGEREVLSAIRKERVAAGEVELSATQLAGDRQADMVSHGGPDKAVYMYPAAHYPFWRSLGYELEPGGVGENASVTGPDESEVRIGDVWEWGGALVQVSQPRSPCFKFGMRLGRKQAVAQMIESARSGWYLRVLRTGPVPTGGGLRLVERDATAPTVRELFTGSFARGADNDPARLREMIGTPALAGQWRYAIEGKLARLEARR
ncbi:MOSC domain-containing protein [Actinomadura rudentiformis]|uniref:MOSC domain-containing protein n=1 Tax=Actinomadura rudentiformis TaxID=359158 RepID=UPI001CEFAED5|nr:MOSC domain-containing protein [Actinomadura rudentiformis]